MIDGNVASGSVMVQHYEFSPRGDAGPIVYLEPAHGAWFDRLVGKQNVCGKKDLQVDLPDDVVDGWDVAQALLLASGSVGYWHPTGFMAYEIGTVLGFRTRVHIWPRGARNTSAIESTFHTHMWPFRSRVVYGTYSERLVSMVTVGAGDLVRYAVEYLDEFPNAVVREEKVRLEPIDEVSMSYQAGSTHSLEPTSWHASEIPPDELVVTVMAIGKVVEPTAFLAGRPGAGTRSVRRQRCTNPELEAVIDEVGATGRSLGSR